MTRVGQLDGLVPKSAVSENWTSNESLWGTQLSPAHFTAVVSGRHAAAPVPVNPGGHRQVPESGSHSPQVQARRQGEHCPSWHVDSPSHVPHSPRPPQRSSNSPQTRPSGAQASSAVRGVQVSVGPQSSSPPQVSDTMPSVTPSESHVAGRQVHTPESQVPVSQSPQSVVVPQSFSIRPQFRLTDAQVTDGTQSVSPDGQFVTVEPS
mmetsp:Transcript_25177/g.70575  ORF Transcript_25177/g.70575 Transcript_25177/m.70575 type:complete len:207 (+) Transcript_25177:376-996(+)